MEAAAIPAEAGYDAARDEDVLRAHASASFDCRTSFSTFTAYLGGVDADRVTDDGGPPCPSRPPGTGALLLHPARAVAREPGSSSGPWAAGMDMAAPPAVGDSIGVDTPRTR